MHGCRIDAIADVLRVSWDCSQSMMLSSAHRTDYALASRLKGVIGQDSQGISLVL